MNIKELKELIKDLPDEMEIILQKDSEGNGYSPLYCGDSEAIYIPETTWYGTVYDLKWTADECCLTEKEWETFKKKYPKALILAPVN